MKPATGVSSTVLESATHQVVFLLSPARCDGRRAEILLREEADFPLAVRLRETGAALGEIFAFMSGLYFRGKLAYAQAFGRTHDGSAVAFVITPGRGLVPPETSVTRRDLLAIGRVGVAPDSSRFRSPLERDARELAQRLGPGDHAVLLGSIATSKYTEVLGECLGPRLRFPAAFVGRGDMSRGGLMLRAARDGLPLETLPVAGAIVRGRRPPKLEPLH